MYYMQVRVFPPPRLRRTIELVLIALRSKGRCYSQNVITWDTLTHVSNTIDATHSETLSNVWIPLVSSV